MKRLLVAILPLMITQLWVPKLTAQLIRDQHSILLTVGVAESNGRGYGQKYLATSLEKAQRRARMYQSENRFDRLHVAASNNAGTFDSTHGIELGLANELDTGYLGNYNLYILKTGVGSTRVHDWMPGSSLFNAMIEKKNKAIALIVAERGYTPKLFTWISIGINDAFAGLSAANFKDSMDIILDELHDLDSTEKFIITKFNQPSYTTYNTIFDAIASERSSYVFTVYDSTAELRTDNTHWDYGGFKKLARQTSTIISQNLFIFLFATIRSRKRLKQAA